MRNPETRKFYAVDVGGKFCPMHAVEGLQPEGAQEITEAEARALSSALRPERPPAAEPPATPAVNLELFEAVAAELAQIRADIAAANDKITSHEHAFEAIKGISL